MMRSRAIFVLAVAAVAACTSSGESERSGTDVFQITLPSTFTDTKVASVGQPTALAFTPDGRLLITQQSGQLRIVQAGTLLPNPAINLSGKICSNSERGLLGVAVDPDFTPDSNNFVYLYYTFNKNNNCGTNGSNTPVNRVSRFVLNANNTLSGELVLLDNIPQPAGNHNGGDVQFGKDKLLYISVGDGGCRLGGGGCGGGNDNARSQSTLLGKILRITKTGEIPSDNPKAQTAGARRCGDPGGVPGGNGPCVEMFAWGLRNPFRFAFDPNAAGTEFFINDVGQNLWEEIDRGAKGVDYGWNTREGHCANNSTDDCGTVPGMTNPIFDYQHGNASSTFNNCNSITGGAFVPNGSFGTSFDGSYLFSDYVCGKIFKLTRAGNGTYSAEVWANALGSSSAVHLRFGPSGTKQALYYTTYANGGEVHKITYTGDDNNRPPLAVLKPNVTFGALPLNVVFDASQSGDPDAGDRVVSYEWNFGDGATQQTTTATASHAYTTAGVFTASLVVRDTRNAPSIAATVRIDAGNTPPKVSITSPAKNATFTVGQTITLSASASDTEDGAGNPPKLTWNVLLNHNGNHTHPMVSNAAGNNVTFTAPPPEDLNAATGSNLQISVTATDSKGLATSVTQALEPAKVQVAFTSEPTGRTIVLDKTTSIIAPATVTSWVGFGLEVNAPAQAGWVFSNWSDGLAQNHVITTPASPPGYKATFRQGFAAKIVFQTAASAAPAGAVADTGVLFGSRSGLQYGWTVDNTAQSRDRGTPGAICNTLNHLQKPVNPNATWEIAVPNGAYSVKIVSGDSANIDSVFRLNAEGALVVNGTPNNEKRWVEGTADVTVSDGKLTVTNAAGGSNNKICSIEISSR